MEAAPFAHHASAEMEARARAPPPSTSVVTCVACRVRLHGPDTRRAHYLSDWHRANIKRKLASLPPLTPDEYTRRVEALATASEGRDGVRRDDGDGGGASLVSQEGPSSGIVMTPSGTYCTICSKRFASTKAAENHLGSRRHIDKARSLMGGAAAADGAESAVGPLANAGGDASFGEDEDDMELEARIANGGAAFPPTTCVFDSKACGSVASTLDHMAAAHGFFMPYVELLVDAEGLLTYLGEKVGLGYACVACDRPFGSVEAVQRHMVDKAHMRMVDDDESWVEEYARFFSADPDDDVGDDEDGEDDGVEGGEWEEVEDEALAAELLDAAGLSAAATATSGAAALVPRAAGGSDRSASRQMVAASAADAANERLQGGADVGEVMDKITASLVLPNGRVLGHRDLARYYKQRPSPAADARALARASTRSAVLSSYKRLGWAGPAASRVTAADQRIQLLRSKREHLRVGMSNYYTRKAAVRPKLGVLNSGYRP
ncbi:hypothetical protein MMPV_007375 [Pyropia vietnamensis]